MKNLQVPTNSANSENAPGTLVATAAEQAMFEVVFSPSPGQFSGGWIDASTMEVGDTVVIRQYVRLSDGGAWLLTYGADTYTGVQASTIAVPSAYSRYGVRVTIQQTAGTLRTLPYEFYYSEGGVE